MTRMRARYVCEEALATYAKELKFEQDIKEGKEVDYTRFFDRFYRKDSSHNSARGGYGIGLSMAETLVGQSKGKISVSWKNDMIAFTVVLP